MTQKKANNSSQTSYDVDEKYKREYIGPLHPPPVQEKYRKEYIGNATDEKKKDRGPYIIVRGQRMYLNEMKPIRTNFRYKIHNRNGRIALNLYKEIYQYIHDLPNPSNDIDFISQPIQKQFLFELVKSIENITSDKDDQARIAISLVQHIPYDYLELKYSSRYNVSFNRFPYEVLFEMKGVCNAKSRLLAFLLKELGFGVALFNFKREKHVAVGIKCTIPATCGFRGTKYTFIESTSVAEIGDSNKTYHGSIRLISMPEIIKICDGKEFDAIPDLEWFLNKRDIYPSNVTHEKSNVGTLLLWAFFILLLILIVLWMNGYIRF
jgi:hypothetical protein